MKAAFSLVDRSCHNKDTVPHSPLVNTHRLCLPNEPNWSLIIMSCPPISRMPGWHWQLSITSAAISHHGQREKRKTLSKQRSGWQAEANGGHDGGSPMSRVDFKKWQCRMSLLLRRDVKIPFLWPQRMTNVGDWANVTQICQWAPAEAMWEVTYGGWG